MRHLLTAACIVAMPGTMNAQGTGSDIEMGARLVDARCAFCHTEKSLPELVERCSSAQGEDYLDGFLADHHAPDEAARADIIAYLTCETPE